MGGVKWKNKYPKQKGKALTGAELEAFAASMGLTVSPKHVPPKLRGTKKEDDGFVDIIVDDLPESLRHLVTEEE